MNTTELITARLAHLSQCITGAQRDGDLSRVKALEQEIELLLNQLVELQT